MNQLSVLIVSGCPHATTRLYRCLHLQEQLVGLGHHVVVRNWDGDVDLKVDVLSGFDLVVLQRVPITRPLRHAIRQLQDRGGIVLFDTDDLVFEPALALQHRAVQQLPEPQQRLYHEGVRRYAATLELSDAVLVSSPLLAELARRRRKQAFVHRNGFGQEMNTLAHQLYSERTVRAPGEQLVIGYGSGTATHDIDFQEVVPALLHILVTYPQVELRLVGPLVLPSALQPYQARIQRLPLTPWQEWLRTASHFDINLAPLEQDNSFCRAKSAIKFTEAAALGIPTVATRIDPFEDAMQHGQTGYLAGHTGDWIDALDRLVVDARHRQYIGEAARSAVLATAGLAKRREEFAGILDQVILRQRYVQSVPVPVVGADAEARAEHTDQQAETDMTSSQGSELVVSGVDGMRKPESTPLVLNWIVSEPIPGSGGFTNLFHIISNLSLFGHECRIYIVPVDRLRHASVAEIERFVCDHFQVRGVRFHRWEGEVADADATIATYWETAHKVAALHNGGRGYYLVQDFEPFFYPVGIQHIQAEQSYRLGLHCITLGHWLARMLQERYGASADAFDFALDHDIFRPLSAPEQGRPPRIVFYARPSTPRRGYEAGIAALKRVHAARPDVEIVLYGADHLPDPPNFYHRNVGILNPYELARLYATADIGVVLSLTNPSLTPLEMMACGCAVVDIASERVEGLLHDGVDSLLASPDPDTIADAILRLLHERNLRQKLIENGYREAGRRSWEESIRQIERVFLQQIPPDERIRQRPYQNAEAEALTWQIHQLLDRHTQGQRQNLQQPARLTMLLDHAIAEQAERARQLQAREDQLHHLIGRSPAQQLWGRLQQTIQPLIQGGQAQLGTSRLYAQPLLGTPLHQRFVADRAHLGRIELLPAPPLGIATRALRLTLRLGDEKGTIVAEQIYGAAEVRPDQPLLFHFEPQSHSYQQTYTLTLASTDATSSDHHRFWCFNAVLHTGARFYRSGQTQVGQLAFQWYSQHQTAWLSPRSGPGDWGNSVQPLPDRTHFLRAQVEEGRQLGRKAAGTLQSHGVGKLSTELRSYLRWRLDQVRDRLGR